LALEFHEWAAVWRAALKMVLLALPAAAAELPEHRITNIFNPLATPAESEKDIAMFVFAITGVIFVGVAGLIGYTIWRFRQAKHEPNSEEPPQVYGSNQIEVAWTVVPILIAFVLIGVSARVIAAVENAPPPPADLKVTVIGHQWWWEVLYPDYGIVTANEIHMPATSDRKNATYLQLQSADVIHSFWLPQLAGKTDLIPNRTNFMWLDPHEPGVYVGNCAEYCGTQHANMLLRVVGEEPKAFKLWTIGQQKRAVDDAQASEGKALFESLACVNCHNISGSGQASAGSKFGPDLTHLMTRQTLGAGVLKNTPENLRAWVNDPQVAKPGCLMPSMKLTPDELTKVVDYLETLR
jgi:cytochrome c oxidase subunit 2